MQPKQRRQAIQALQDAADSLMKSAGPRKRRNKKPRGTPDFKTTDEMLEYAMRHKGERDVPAPGIRYRGTTSDSEIPDTFGRVWASTVSARDLGRIDPKKFYVVIPFSDEYGKKEMADLSNGVLDGVLGISEKHQIIMQWYGMARDAILVMDADKLTKINKLSRVQYDNPEYLVSNGMAALYRIFDKKRDKSGSYGLAGNLIDHILMGVKSSKKPGGEVLSEAKDLAGTIEKHAEELRRSLKALPFEDKDDLLQAVRSVSNRMDKDDIEDFAKFSEKAVKNLTEFSTSYDGLSERLIKLYLDSDYEMEPGERIREAAALAPKAEATALDWGWDATQTEALVKVMTDFATLVQDFDAIKALSKKGSSEVASLSGDGAISYALGYDRGRALEKSFGDSGTDDIKTVKGLAKRFADVFKDSGHNYKDITLPAWERAIRKGLKSIGNTFADEGEWLVKDKKLKIPSGSTLFVTKDEAVTPTLWDKEPVKADRYDQMIKKYDLDKRYKVQRIDRAKFDKARSLYLTSPKKVASSALKAAHKAVAEARKLLASTLVKKGHRFDTYFYGDDSGTWTASGAIFGFRKEWDWEMAPSLSSKNDWRNFSVEGATENNAGFRKALKAIVADYPEVADFWLSFDGPMKPVREVLGLSDSDSWNDLVFLHGTSTTFLPTIEKEGLRPRGQTSVKPAYGHGSNAKPGNPDLLYFTTQETMAKFAARAAAAVHGGEPIILEVRNLDKAKAEPDEDSREKTAEASLARMGSIGYRGRVSANQIKARRSLSASARLVLASYVSAGEIFTDETGKFWGSQGAGGVFLAEDTGRLLIQKRSPYVNEPNTWGTFGGKIDEGEDPKQAMEREIEEESSYRGPKKVKLVYTFQDGKFKFHNYLVTVPHEFEPKHSWETSDHAWVTLDDLPSPLHFGFKSFLPHLKSELGHKLAASASVVGDPMDFQREFMAKYPAAKPLLKLLKGTKRGKARGTETASYEGGYVILKDDFYEKAEKYGREFAEAVYAHELGHIVETEVFRDIDSMASAIGINVWDRNQLPFGTYNFSEGIADTFSVLLLKDPADLALLRSRWPKWEELTRQCAERVGVRLTANQTVAAKSFSDVDIPRDFRVMFFLPNEKVPTLGAQLARRQLEGVTGITDSGQVLMLRMLGANRNAMLVMPGAQTAKLNKLSRIMYENPEYWMSKDMAALIRVYGGNTDHQAAINRIFQAADKSPGSKDFMRKVATLDVFPGDLGTTPVNSVKDLAKQWFTLAKAKVLAKMKDNGVEETDPDPSKWADSWAKDRYAELLSPKAYVKAITDGLKVIAKTFVWEGEWLLKDKTLRIPQGSRLFVTKPKGRSDQARFEAQQALIAEHGLDKVYKIVWVDGEKLQQTAMKYGMTAADKLVKQRLPTTAGVVRAGELGRVFDRLRSLQADLERLTRARAQVHEASSPDDAKELDADIEEAVTAIEAVLNRLTDGHQLQADG